MLDGLRDVYKRQAFTVYDDIRQKLIAHGMPADQIAFILSLIHI